jgi:type II secretory pathway pseudopilin PulG
LKKSFSLIEVLVSVMLVSTVIIVMLQTKNNSLFFLEKFETNSFYHSCISLVSTMPTSDEKIYIEDKINFDDDDIRTKLKNIKIVSKIADEKEIKIANNEYIKKTSIQSATYTIEHNEDTKISQKFYTFKLGFNE